MKRAPPNREQARLETTIDELTRLQSKHAVPKRGKFPQGKGADR